jgi:hypothetical protein
MPPKLARFIYALYEILAGRDCLHCPGQEYLLTSTVNHSSSFTFNIHRYIWELLLSTMHSALTSYTIRAGKQQQ